MTTEREDIFVYLSGPITAKHGRSVEEHVAAALKVYLRLTAAGILSFCPHLSALAPSAHLYVSYDRWMEMDYRMIDRCTEVLMLPNWQQSNGALAEHAYAERLSKPIYYALDDYIRQVTGR